MIPTKTLNSALQFSDKHSPIPTRTNLKAMPDVKLELQMPEPEHLNWSFKPSSIVSENTTQVVAGAKTKNRVSDNLNGLGYVVTQPRLRNGFGRFTFRSNLLDLEAVSTDALERVIAR
jgi:hypothetical protein